MSQQEDDLRALAKIMDFLRAVSIILVVMNVYWFCYEAIRLWGVNIGVVDKILLNFDRTAGLTASSGSGRGSNHQFRKNSTNPTANAVQILPQVIFSPLTPFVPRQDKASKRTENSFV